MKRYGDELFRTNSSWSNQKHGCLLNFEFARLQLPFKRWAIYVPEFSETEVAAIFKTKAGDQLLPVVKKVASLRTLMKRLFEDEEPCPWSCINGAIRAAQYIAVASELELQESEIISTMIPYSKWIKMGLGRNPVVMADEYIKCALADWNTGLFDSWQPKISPPLRHFIFSSDGTWIYWIAKIIGRLSIGLISVQLVNAIGAGGQKATNEQEKKRLVDECNRLRQCAKID